MIHIHNFTLRKNSVCFLILFLCAFYLIPAPWAVAEAPGSPVAEVNGKILTEMDVQEALNEIMPAARFHRGFSSEKRLAHRPEAIEKMIEKELFYQEALKQGLVAETKMVEADRNKAIQRFGSQEAYRSALEKLGLTDAGYTEKIEKKYLVKQITTLEVVNKARVSDKEIKSYYEKNKERFLRPEARRLMHVLIKVPPNATSENRSGKKQLAQELINRIKAGEDMSLIAWDHSQGPYRVKGGDLGLVHKGSLEPEIDAVAFGLETGQLSPLIETRYGYHFVRVEEIRPPEQLTLEHVAQKIKSTLTEQKEERLRQNLIQRLRAQARIKVY